MLRKLWLLSTVFALLNCNYTFAQDYVPPPMFGAPKGTDNPEARVSKRVDLDAPKKQNTVNTASVSEKITLPASFSQGLETPPLPVQKPDIKPQTITDTVITEQSVKTRKNTGVVTGPKTMPSVPAQGYEAEETFEDASAQDNADVNATILKRHEQAIAKDIAKETVSTPDQGDGTELKVFEYVDDKAKKIAIPYTQGTESVSNGVIGSVQRQSLLILAELGDQSRLQIMSYATPFDSGLSSDRRMSLTRALSLRDALLNAGVDAHRIDIRALGKKTDDPQKDRIDLIFYAEKAPQ